MNTNSYDILFPDPENRTPVQQGGYQIAALAVALGIALVAGTLTGFLMKWGIWDNLTDTEYYEDDVFWDVCIHTSLNRINFTQF